MPFSQVLVSPAGTGVNKLINLPQAGGWNGNVIISFASSSSISITGLKFIRDAGGAGIIERTIGSVTVGADTRKHYSLQDGEALVIFTYTCSAKITICVESKRGP